MRFRFAQMQLANLKKEENEHREKDKAHPITLLLELISTLPSKKMQNRKAW